MISSLQKRDAAAIADIQKLRFFPHSIVAGEGSYLIEEDGRRLLDLSATWGAASLGYAHPALVKAVSAVLEKQPGASILSAVSQPAVELAEELMSIVPTSGQRRVWLGHSGSDANEAALRSIMAASGRTRVISFIGAYHGGTAGSMSISGHSSQTGAPKLPGSLFLPYPNPFRPFSDDPSGNAILELLDYHLDTDCPPEDVAAVFIEPVMSDGGLIVPPPGFLKAIADRVSPHGVMIVCDEVKVGLGRSGKWNCFQHEGITPDVVTLGKGLGGGLPLSAVVGPADILDVTQAFAMETTCGNPISASAGLAVLKTVREENLPDHAAEIGHLLLSGLQDMAGRHRLIGDVRGRGLVLGIELVKDKTTREPAPLETAKVVYRAYELGAVIYYVGLYSNVLELTPPLILSSKEAEEAIEILDQAITDVEHDRVSDEKIRGFKGW
ncbi:MAG: aspartate aminotransferase family protein [Deltaproteobacteria bacterium]|nr:aspartate aminotransferase family protein [Deltaproteobacteria bacterium]